MWASMSLSEKSEAFETIQLEENQMRKDGTLASKGIALYGAGITHDASLHGLMGELSEVALAYAKELKEKRTSLKDEGKSNIEADRILRAEYEDKTKGVLFSIYILFCLQQQTTASCSVCVRLFCVLLRQVGSQMLTFYNIKCFHDWWGGWGRCATTCMYDSTV